MAADEYQVVNLSNPKHEDFQSAFCQQQSQEDDLETNELETLVENSTENSEIEKSGLLGVNLQPEKILEVFSLPDGSNSYQIAWKASWVHEQFIKSYQYLLDDFWLKRQQEKEKNQQPDEITQNLVVKPAISKEKKVEKNDVEDPPLSMVETPIDLHIDSEKTNEDVDKKEGESSKKRKLTGIENKKKTKKTRGRPRKSSVQMKFVRPDDEEGEDGGGEKEVEEDEKKKCEKFIYGDAKGPVQCDICGKLISNKYGLREHQSVVHFKNGRFQCEVCGKRVTNKRALNLHMTAHSNTRAFVCDQCGSSHKTKGNLNYHIKTMHTMIKNFRCDICFKTFKVQADLKEHCFTAHANAGVITCIVCKKKLTTALSIYTHSVMHSGAREFECDVCGYAFKTLTGLKEHRVTHSENKPVRTCPYCDKKFYSRSQYNAHVMRHTADGGLVTYKCPVCGTKFQHKSSYNRHVIRHQPGGDLEFPKENPYLLLDESELPEGVCHKCRKHYSSKSGFYLHIKKCRDGIVQQYECPYCDSGCANRSSLKRHIQRRHKGMEYKGQTIQGREIIQKEQPETGVAEQPHTITNQDGIQYQNTYFEHGYGNHITAVDTSQLTAVDVQLLIDTANQGGDGGHLLVNQIQPNSQENNQQNLHILTENEAAQFTAHLTQQGVIIRSTDVGGGDQLVVSNARIDPATGQLLVSENQAAQIIANAQVIANNQLQQAGNSQQLTESPLTALQGAGELHFAGSRVIQIQNIADEQVLEQHIDQEAQLKNIQQTMREQELQNIQQQELQTIHNQQREMQTIQQQEMQTIQQQEMQTIHEQELQTIRDQQEMQTIRDQQEMQTIHNQQDMQTIHTMQELETGDGLEELEVDEISGEQFMEGSEYMNNKIQLSTQPDKSDEFLEED